MYKRTRFGAKWFKLLVARAAAAGAVFLDSEHSAVTICVLFSPGPTYCIYRQVGNPDF